MKTILPSFRRHKSMSRLPKQVILDILKKMNVKDRVQMRQTCTFVNSVAERHQKELSSTPSLGTDLIIEFRKQDSFAAQRYCEELRFSSSFVGDSTKLIEKDFERRISGISFKHIHVGIERREPFLQILKLFQRIQPICEQFILRHCPFELLVPFTDCVTFSGFFRLDFREFIITADMDTVLATLKAAQKRSQFAIIATDFWNINENILDKMKHFYEVHMSAYRNGVHGLLLDLQNATEKVALKRLNLLLSSDNNVFRDAPSLPSIQRIREPKWIKEPDILRVRVMSLPSQFVVIEEYIPMSIRSTNSKLVFSFVDKTPSALREKLSSIWIDPDFVEFAAETDDGEDEEEVPEDVEKIDYYFEDDPEWRETDPRKRYGFFIRDIRLIVSSFFQN